MDRRNGLVDSMDPPGRSRLRGRQSPGRSARGAILRRGTGKMCGKNGMATKENYEISPVNIGLFVNL